MAKAIILSRAPQIFDSRPTAAFSTIVKAIEPRLGPRMSPASLVRQLPAIVFFKAAQVLGLGLFSVLAPRYLGPELFGRFAVILSLTGLWMTTSNLGARYVFGR